MIDGSLFEKAREYRGGQSQEAVARAIGVDQSYISKLEKGAVKGGIRAKELFALADHLKLDINYFTGRLSLAEADLETAPARTSYAEAVEKAQALQETLSEMQKKLDEQQKSDELLDKVRTNADLRSIVHLVRNQEGGILKELRGLIWQYLRQRESPERGLVVAERQD